MVQCNTLMVTILGDVCGTASHNGAGEGMASAKTVFGRAFLGSRLPPLRDDCEEGACANGCVRQL